MSVFMVLKNAEPSISIAALFKLRRIDMIFYPMT
jgi:hypothetical protein